MRMVNSNVEEEEDEEDQLNDYTEKPKAVQTSPSSSSPPSSELENDDDDDDDDDGLRMAISALSDMRTVRLSQSDSDNFIRDQLKSQSQSVIQQLRTKSTTDSNTSSSPSSSLNHHSSSSSPSIVLDRSSDSSSSLGLSLPSIQSRPPSPSSSNSTHPRILTSLSTSRPSFQPSDPSSSHSLYLDSDGRPVDQNGHPLNLVRLQDPQGGVFFQRVGRMPLVSGVVRAYERGKGTSRVVRYGADLVESSVTSISGRVVSSVGPERIAQIDRYAGAALDRLGQFSGIQPPMINHHQEPPIPSDPTSTHPSTHRYHQTDQQDEQPSESSECYRSHNLSQADPLQSDSSLRRRKKSSTRADPHPGSSELEVISQPGHERQSSEEEEEEEEDEDDYRRRRRRDDRSCTPREFRNDASSDGTMVVEINSNERRSRWQSMLVEASMTAGGIGAAVSEESMKSLKYCLQWLHYATVHLDHQITVLRDFIASLNVHRGSSDALISPTAVQTLADIKREVVETIRKVVDVVSKYAGGALPEQAKVFVRNIILGLPLRWASSLQAENMIGQQQSRSGTNLNGSHEDEVNHGDSNQPNSSSSSINRNSNTRGTTEVAADRVLTFAVESLDMLKSLTGIFSESVDRADAWIERLRVMGIQHRNQRDVNEQPRSARNSILQRRQGPNQGSCDSLSTVTGDRPGPSPFVDHSTNRRSRDSSRSTSCDECSISSTTGGPDRSNPSVATTVSSSNDLFGDRNNAKRRKGNQNSSSTSATSITSGTSNPSSGNCGGGAGIDENSRSSLKKLLLDFNVSPNTTSAIGKLDE
ncbi:transcription factor Opi1-domain-containing protein [Phakopsora pachyrhizi]|nr:transcription factor Opi1-domain-containing protein [Phakopsora pachyrhizi]